MGYSYKFPVDKQNAYRMAKEPAGAVKRVADEPRFWHLELKSAMRKLLDEAITIVDINLRGYGLQGDYQITTMSLYHGDKPLAYQEKHSARFSVHIFDDDFTSATRDIRDAMQSDNHPSYRIEVSFVFQVSKASSTPARSGSRTDFLQRREENTPFGTRRRTPTSGTPTPARSASRGIFEARPFEGSTAVGCFSSTNDR